MIKAVGTGLYADDDVAEGFVTVQLRVPGRPQYIDLYCGPQTALHLRREGLVGKVVELFGTYPGATFALASQHLQPRLADEMLDVVMALRLLEPDFTAEHCQYPPCILRTSRVVGGYGLCSHHGDALLDAAEFATA